MRFGAHMSITGGLERAISDGLRAGCDTVQLFTKNQQQWRAKPLGDAEVVRFRAATEQSGLGPLVVHDSYLINLASPDDALWQKSCTAFADELDRCAVLGIPYLVTHPGAHVGSGEAAGLARVANAISRLLDAGHGTGVMILLETTAGQGTSLGWRFEQLAELLRAVDAPERVGVCIDTCHLFAAGYDLRTPEAYAATFAEFEAVIGCAAIKAIHVNDAQRDLGSRIDRHAHIGDGTLGLAAFRALVNDPRLAGLPAILETPKGDDLAEDITNLAVLRGLVDA